MDISKKAWNLFNDVLGKTILHPQYFLKSYEHLAIEELKRKAKGTLVDIGCGRQTYKKELLGKVDKYIGIDHPDVSKKYEDKEMPDILADAQDLPLADNFCQTASMISVLEHIPEPLIALKEASRILKPDGKLILITVQNYPLHDSPFDFYRYTRFSLKNLLEESGLKVNSIKPIGSYPVFAGQTFNVYILNKIKVGLKRGIVSRAISIILVIPVFLLCFLSNLIALLASKITKDYEPGAFAIYNLAVATKVSKRK